MTIHFYTADMDLNTKGLHCIRGILLIALLAGNFSCFLLPADIFSKSTFSKNSFANNFSVKQFGSRSAREWE